MINQHQLFGTIVKISFYRVSKPCFPPEINRNDPKYFKSEIGTPQTKFLESPLLIYIYIYVCVYIYIYIYIKKHRQDKKLH